MAMVAESPESDSDNNSSKTNNPQTLNETAPFLDYALAQAQLYHKAFNDAVDSTIDTAKSRFSQIRSTSSAHFHQTLDSLDDLKSQYTAYEGLLFGKIKEGVVVAASHPVITCGATASLGLLGLVGSCTTTLCAFLLVKRHGVNAMDGQTRINWIEKFGLEDGME
ncbi:hypothetical protein JHK82_031080 [Glycine max]|nr:hypothetical protein JHK87_030992 [Glycine soja]KAG5124343.1 hypothetical protein JHK82_031080 [Glycine max]KAG5145764.1 hypothetical protein JHK84_031307 [Glycine max]